LLLYEEVESKCLGDSWYELNRTFSAKRALGTGSLETPLQPSKADKIAAPQKMRISRVSKFNVQPFKTCADCAHF
jgi:hypothetical protein